MFRQFLLAAVTVSGLTAAPALAGQEGPWGGGGGVPFNAPPPVPGSRIVEIVVRHGAYIDGIQLVWQLPDGRYYYSAGFGGSGGQFSSFRLDPNERLVRVEGRSGVYVDGLRFVTDRGRRSPWYGGNGGLPFVT